MLMGEQLMPYRTWWIGLILASLCAGADKKLPIEVTSNEKIEISATALTEKDQIQKELGSDLGGDIVVVRVTVHNVTDKPIQVSLDDFLLVSAKDGQRSEPFAPSQIAGNTSLVLTPQGTRNGMGGAPNRPTFGGLGGIGGGGIGNTAGVTTGVEAKVDNSKANEPNPLLAVLKEKVLQEKEITDTETGLLYFQMVGKLKPKDLELHYKGPAGKVSLRFRP
jgi:hypothetical protein